MADRVAQMIRYANKTGLCVVCRRKKRKRVSAEGTPGLRMTCGEVECINKWTNPGRKYNDKQHMDPRKR